jgi:hypothetical protein
MRSLRSLSIVDEGCDVPGNLEASYSNDMPNVMQSITEPLARLKNLKALTLSGSFHDEGAQYIASNILSHYPSLETLCIFGNFGALGLQHLSNSLVLQAAIQRE